MNKEISNNILVLILIVIIFVSILGTITVKQAIDTVKSLRTAPAQPPALSVGSGMVSINILPPEQQKESERDTR